MTTTTPATTTPASTTPRSDYELRKVKIARALSEETTAFTGELWHNGHLIAHCSNRGSGDPIQIDYVAQTFRQQHDAYCDTQPNVWVGDKYFPEGRKVDSEIHVGELLADWETTQTLTRQCKKKLLFRLQTDAPGAYRNCGGATIAGARTAMQTKYGDQIELIFNDDIPAAVKLLRSHG